MDYGRPDLADRLAAEYVAGTLRGPARRRLESLLPAHPELRRAVDAWQHRLVPLTAGVPPVTPPASVWTRLEQRLKLGPSPATRTRIGLWRAWAALASAAAVGLAVLLVQAPTPVAPVVIVLAPTEAATAGLSAFARVSFVAGISADRRAVTMRPVNDVPLEAGRSLELWAVPGQGAPRSLGLLSRDAATTVRPAQALAGAAALAVSLEPQGGSRTGAPTGPVLFVGRL